MRIPAKIFTEYEYLASLGRYSYFLQFLPGTGVYNHFVCETPPFVFASEENETAGEHTEQ